MAKTPLAALPPDPKLYIRAVRTSDIDALHHGCLSDKPRIWINHIVSRALRNAEEKRGTAVVIVNRDTSEIIAFGQFTLWTRCGEISDLIVHHHQRGQGLGTALIQHLVQYARSIEVPCVEIGAARSNPRALQLYLRLGFVEQRIIRVDLGNGQEDVVLLKLYL